MYLQEILHIFIKKENLKITKIREGIKSIVA